MPRLALSLLAAASLYAAPTPPAPYQPSEGGSVALNLFQLPEGLEVTVWARSPMLANPTNIDFDAQGRLWVNEGVNYRIYNKGGKRRAEGDRVVVLSDTKGKGFADSVNTFVQDPEWTAPLGICVIDNVVYVSHAPTITKFTDVNRDGKFDPAVDKKEVFLTGFGGQDHDHSLHAVVTGPDGKLYINSGNCGGEVTDKSGKTFRISSGYVDMRGGKWPYDPKAVAGAKSDDGFVWTSGFSGRLNADGTNLEILGNGYRNSFESFPSSLGDLFQGDNDDSQSCRTSFVLEYGSAGYTTPSGANYNSVKRPGQSMPRAHWRQDDPDTMDVGDVYGGGSPTGITVYENGALGDAWVGTLLNCEPSRNTVLAYKLVAQKGSFALNADTRKDLITSNPAREFVGTDFKHITAEEAAKPNERIMFRPSDVTVGPDGAIYVADWYDSRVGGHQTLDDTCTGAIYRIAPKGFKSVIPKIDLSSPEGAAAVLRNPAVNVRHLGFNALKGFGAKSLPAVAEIMRDSNPYVAARGVWLLPYLGDEGVARVKALLKDANPSLRRLAFQSLRRAGHDTVGIAAELAKDSDVAVRRDVATSLHAVSADKAVPILIELARHLDVSDKNSIAAFGIGSAGKQDAVWAAVKSELAKDGSETWSPAVERIAWLLHPASSVSEFVARASSAKVSPASRTLAVESLSFVESKEAALAMIKLCAEGSPCASEAKGWALMRMSGTWSSFDIRAELKNAGVYDAKKVVVSAIQVADEPAPTFTEQDVLAKTGDVVKGAALAQRCIMCHQINGNGPAYGPELRGFATRQSREAVVRAIVNPSADIALGFEGTSLKLKAGGRVDGRLLSNNDPIVITSMGGVTQLVPKDRVSGQSKMTRSLMMSGQLLGLSAQEVADVAAWLATYN
ncbi:MAG: PVC-type heme-binding CxxCH protein [Verrucomicrobiota bacterium]